MFKAEKDKKFFDFIEVRKMIEKLTDEIAGNNKGIVDKPIIISLYSKECPDLTLVDLPGITRIPLKGSDQGKDIEKVTKAMAYKYLLIHSTYILWHPLTSTDMSATSEVLSSALSRPTRTCRPPMACRWRDRLTRMVRERSVLLRRFGGGKLLLVMSLDRYYG